MKSDYGTIETKLEDITLEHTLSTRNVLLEVKLTSRILGRENINKKELLFRINVRTFII
jgi:hypothetical protein